VQQPRHDSRSSPPGSAVHGSSRLHRLAGEHRPPADRAGSLIENRAGVDEYAGRGEVGSRARALCSCSKPRLHLGRLRRQIPGPASELAVVFRVPP